MRTATIVLADTHKLHAQGLKVLVEARNAYNVIEIASDGFSAFEACCARRPDMLIVDVAIPGLDALEICRQLKRYSSPTRVLLTLPFVQQERLVQAMRYGAAGAVLKTAGVDQLYDTMEAVLDGQRRFPAELTPVWGRMIGRSLDSLPETPYSRLTARERTIFKLLAEGHSVKQVASQLELKPKTVDVHKTNLMRKLDVHDRGELIHFAFREGLVGVGDAPAGK
jgi:DNA-binding NarL/FixJ family response regulator